MIPGLKYLYCSGNRLSGLEIKGHSRLYTLDCSHNEFTALHIDAPQVCNVKCKYNKLENVTIKTESPLQLWCDNAVEVQAKSAGQDVNIIRIP